jgi:UDP-glucose 4-epimerase
MITMNVLVCGGAGYIGSSLVRMLAERGDRVVVFDNLRTAARSTVDNHPGIELVEGNLLNPKDLYLLFRRYKFDSVYHLAFRSPYTTDNPGAVSCYRNNVTGTMNLLGEMRSNDINHIVFASSAVVYGKANGGPLSEKQTLTPVDGFASTNSTVEQMLEHFNREYGLNSVSLRFFNASGVDSAFDTPGLDTNNKSDLFKVLNACQINGNSGGSTSGNAKYEIPAGDHPIADDSTVKEYLHVLDVCDAHMKAMDYLFDDNDGAHVYNLGDERGYSASELVRLAENITGNKAVTTITNHEKGPSLQLLSSERAKKDLDWKPQHNVEAIMKTLWQVMSEPAPEHSRAGETCADGAGHDAPRDYEIKGGFSALGDQSLRQIKTGD